MTKSIWGSKKDGKNGVMSDEDFLAFVISEAGEGGKEWKKNVGKAYNAIVNNDGQTGASDKFPHKGKGVCHVPEGRRGRTRGVSVFFTVKGEVVASIIGIGHQIGSRSYELEWQLPTWDTESESITL